MAGEITPFLTVNDFSAMFPRQLTDQESALAVFLLEAAALWIRNAIAAAGRTPLDATDPMAKLVSFEVTRDALAVPADLLGHISYQHATDNRSEGGTLAAAGGLLDFTEKHRRMLGLSATALPQYGGFEHGFGDTRRGYHYQNTPAGPVVVGAVVIGDEPW
jgi:hypothetical protein